MTTTQTSTQTATRPAPPKSTVAPTGCCPPFDPETFHDKEVTWKGKLFVRARVHSLFHVPLDMQQKVTKVMRLLAGADAAAPHGLMLSDELSPWKSDLYIEATRSVAGAEMTALSGTFLTRVYEGPYRDAPRWVADMEAHCRAMNREPRKIYFGYTTCPRCAKAYGKNYVVLLAEVRPLPEAVEPSAS